MLQFRFFEYQYDAVDMYIGYHNECISLQILQGWCCTVYACYFAVFCMVHHPSPTAWDQWLGSREGTQSMFGHDRFHELSAALLVAVRDVESADAYH